MPSDLQSALSDLPRAVGRALEEFVGTVTEVLGSDLRAVILFGTAAEGKLRETSDVNVLLILTAFDPAKATRLREPLQVGRATIRLAAMLLLEDEIPAAAEAFAQKFQDILRRHRVLFGVSPFAQLTIPREALIRRLRQVLLNLILRLRESYVSKSLNEEQLPLVIAEAAGPLRTSAAAVLELEDQSLRSPKEALEHITASQGEAAWSDTLRYFSQARETRTLPPGVAGPTLLRLIELAHCLWDRSQRLT